MQLFFFDKKDVYSKGYFMNIHIHANVMLCELHMVHKIVGYWGM